MSDASDAPASRGALTPRSVDFPRWYQEVVARAELADNGPVRGTMVIRPWAYAVWERLQGALDERIKAVGVDNAYFPLFIPESYLRLEAEHVEGFSPELAVVTHAGGQELDEPLVVRPTSETVINSFFAKWIQSYRDLPFAINQWANIVRWELRPRLFLRSTEFLWQEGHTAHASADDARAFALRILDEVYGSTLREVAAIPYLAGHKTAKERFAGATQTWTLEAMMGDGKALQMGTSHELGQNFSRAFGIEYADERGERQFPWQTSWGVSTRLLGALVMAHGDDWGLRLPPALAPRQVVVVAVRDDPDVLSAARALADELGADGHRVQFDDRVEVGFGRRSVEWELKGVPIRVEVGPRDLVNDEVTLVRRHLRTKEQAPISGAAAAVRDALGRVAADLAAEGSAALADRTVAVTTCAEAVEACASGFARLAWSAIGVPGEAELAKEGVTVRCLLTRDGSLGGPQTPDAELDAIVARAY
jgi:prolyl-tRNA synthetase